MLNCTAGNVDDSNFSKPMPIIGVYMAAASLLCALAMGIDAAKGFWSNQYWIPSKYFSLNAASLTVVGVAIKLSVDLNSPMPSKIDQLAKLSTSAFICTVLANIQPSLGKLEKGELLANTVALAILIITSIVNLCIQLDTGVILSFKAAHIIMIVMMCLILHECIATAAYFPVLKIYLNDCFERKARWISGFWGNTEMPEYLEAYIRNFALMAQSSCPELVMARSVRSFSVTILGSVSASTLFVILIASLIHKDNFMGLNTCSGESDYGWSVLGILITQIIAVVVGLVAPVNRLICFIGASKEGGVLHSVAGKRCDLKALRKDEEFQMWRLYETRESPIFLHIEDRQQRPTVYLIKYACRRFLSLFKFFCSSAFTSKIFMYIIPQESGLALERMGHLWLWSISHVQQGQELTVSRMKPSSCVIERYIDAGKRGSPQNLIKFLKEHLSCDLDGVASFENDELWPKSLKSGNCWSLAVLTLTSVAAALPNVDPASKERLMRSVNEGLVYVKLVEDHVRSDDGFMNIRAAASTIWLGLDREMSWLTINLPELALKSESPREVLDSFIKFNRDDWYKQRTKLKNRVPEIDTCSVVMDSMYRVCQTMLQQHNWNEDSSKVVFKKLSTTIADVLGACFTNLIPCITSICKRCSMEQRRETALRMLKVLGETQEIMEILYQEGRNIPDIPDDERGLIEKWRSHLKRQNDLSSSPDIV